MQIIIRNSLFKIKLLLLVVFCIAAANFTAMAVPSDLDPTFGTGGIVGSGPAGNQAGGGADTALQADGKIVMIGNSTATGSGFVVARFNADGSFDTTFGGGDGWVVTPFGQNSTARSVAIQADGKIVVGGYTADCPPNMSCLDFAIARYNTDGSLDTGFAGDGKVTISFNETLGTFYADFLSSVRIAPDGKIVVGGNSGDAQILRGHFVLARLNTDGSLDSSFGMGGRIIHPTLAQLDLMNDMIVQPDGSIVAVGYSHGVTFSPHIAIKYSASGSTDWTYLQSYPGVATDTLEAVVAQPDGKFIVAGKRAGLKASAIRLNANGTVDSAFNLPASGIPTGFIDSLAIQPNGKILATLNTAPGGGVIPSRKFTLMRLNPNGSLDTDFNGIGNVQTTVVPDVFHGGNVLLQPDGKILIGGTVGSNFALVRYIGRELTGPRSLFDFDGDSKADIGIFRQSSGTWFLQKSSSGEFIQAFGTNGDKVAAADYDGDAKTDLAIYRNGDWWFLNSSNSTVGLKNFGTATDVPLPSDFDADGKADFIYYRPSSGEWFRSGSTGASSTVQFGLANDVPVIADMDGDGKTDPTIFRPSTGTWWYRSSVTNADTAVQWGQSGDVPVTGDYDGDGKTDAAIFRPSDGLWYVLKSSGDYSVMQWGMDGDSPVAADYDGDGKADVAVYRPSTGVWFIMRSTAGFTGLQYGFATDKPVPNAYVQ